MRGSRVYVIYIGISHIHIQPQTIPSFASSSNKMYLVNRLKREMKAMPSVQNLTVNHDQAGQRLDNFLIKVLKGVPRPRIYRAIRNGEVRVNKGRTRPDYRLQFNDQLRVPPVDVSTATKPVVPLYRQQSLAEAIIFEDEDVWVINKPAGMAVHGGSGIYHGLIDILRARFGHDSGHDSPIQLVHRLDRDTSGCLLIAKNRKALTALQRQFHTQTIQKKYLALVKGHWPKHLQEISVALRRDQLQSGERMVVADEAGKASTTHFEPLRYFENATLVMVKPLTGRTHQIRAHAVYAGHPIAGDEKYGDKQFNLQIKKLGLNRLFLHAAELQWHSQHGHSNAICACLDAQLKDVLSQM